MAGFVAAESVPGRSVLALSVRSSFAPIGFALGQWAGGIGSSLALLVGLAAAGVLAIAGLGVYRRRLGEARQ